jgi:hypothetical protein
MYRGKSAMSDRLFQIVSSFVSIKIEFHVISFGLLFCLCLIPLQFLNLAGRMGEENKITRIINFLSGSGVNGCTK